MTQPDDQQPAVPLPPGWGQQQPPQPQQPPAHSPWAQPEGQQPPAQQPAQPQPPAQPESSPWSQPQEQPQPPGQPQQPVYPTPQDPFYTTTMTPTSAQIPAFGPMQPPQPPKKRNVGLIITAVALGVMLVLCAVGGVGAFLLLRNSDGTGAESARDAAAGFLTAVYKDGDAKEAEKLVCSEARDTKAIEAKIKEIRDQKARYKSPSITWDAPKIENETAEKADTTITVRLTTSDEKVSEQTLKLSLVKREGWFVCEVEEQKQ